jgi:branched-chain amino acid transport system ATP-binding protein
VARVMGIIAGLRDQSGLTIVLVEQNARSALATADSGVVLNLGRVVAADKASSLSADVALRRHYLGF